MIQNYPGIPPKGFQYWKTQVTSSYAGSKQKTIRLW